MEQENRLKPKLFTMESENIISLTDSNFDEETYESELPALVMFGAERCAQCKEELPMIEEIAGEYKGRVKVCWIEVDKYPTLQQRLRLRGIPNLLLFKEGAVEGRLGGLREKDEVVEMLENVI